MGEDWFDGELLNDKEIGQSLRNQLVEILNSD